MYIKIPVIWTFCHFEYIR